ncbi:MAG: tetraacyldisaccharide 4'-kinase [Sedimentisphaerales bacterium]|nr:tetraacyldisaccharide 4'-kinase [Sedimentisphaerales bacterium]
MDQANIKKLISGEKTGFAATVLRFLLGAASIGYSIAIGLRNLLYSAGLFKTHSADAVVISIGNITTGGTGKTPLVIWLCKKLISDYQCAILMRGYKTSVQETEHLTDEPAIFSESCPEVKVIVNPDRVAGAEEAAIKFGSKVLVMDDGFQHRRLARDLDIVAIDATLPFGYGRMLPAGLLREPVSSLKRAGAVVITRCDQIAENELSGLEEKLRLINPDMVISRSIHAPAYAKTINNKEIRLEELKGKKIFAFSGIGNPGSFLNTIKTTGAKLVGSKTFNDHHHYTEACIADIFEQAARLKADLILTTQKDQNKITCPASSKTEIPLVFIGIEIRFLSGEEKLWGLIEKTLAGKMPKM